MSEGISFKFAMVEGFLDDPSDDSRTATILVGMSPIKRKVTIYDREIQDTKSQEDLDALIQEKVEQTKARLTIDICKELKDSVSTKVCCPKCKKNFYPWGK